MDIFSGGPRYLEYIHICMNINIPQCALFYIFTFDGFQAGHAAATRTSQEDHKSFFIFCFLLNANDVQYKIDPFKEFYALMF